MKQQQSYIRHQNDLMHRFRERLNHAESDQDIKRMYFQTMKDLFVDIFEDDLGLEFHHLRLVNNKEPFFDLDSEIAKHPRLRKALEDSDLSLILATFAEQACHHLLRRQHHPENTENKIRL